MSILLPSGEGPCSMEWVSCDRTCLGGNNSEHTTFMKIRAFWDVSPCSLIGVDRRFRRAYCLHHKGDEINALMMEAVCTSETSVYSETSWRCIPEDSNLHTRCHENLESHTTVRLCVHFPTCFYWNAHVNHCGCKIKLHHISTRMTDISIGF
jgi:hypothetical protein